MTSDRRSLASRLERHTVRAGTLSSLLAGRALYRLVYLGTTVLLLPVWGEQRYGGYAAAMATLGWLMVLVFIGPEKTVLKLLPRAPRAGPLLTRALLAVLWWLPLPLAAAFGLVLALGGTDRTALYLGVAAMLLSIGCTHLLVGLHRAVGRPRMDTSSFLVMTIVQLGVFGGAAAGYLAPVGYVGAVVAAQVALNLALSAMLGRPSLEIRHRPRFLSRLAWTAVMLSGTDLFVYLAAAVLFATLAASSHAGQVGRLYALSLIWTAGVTMLLYLFRVYAPWTSLRLVGRGAPAGRGRAARLAVAAAFYNVLWLVVAGSVVAMAGLAGIASPVGQTLVWAGLLATRAPAVAVLLWANFQLENTDATAPRVVGLAAVAGLAVALLAGLAAVPSLGAIGLIGSLAAGDLGYALVVAWRGGGPSPDRRRRLAPRPAPDAAWRQFLQ